MEMMNRDRKVIKIFLDAGINGKERQAIIDEAWELYPPVFDGSDTKETIDLNKNLRNAFILGVITGREGFKRLINMQGKESSPEIPWPHIDLPMDSLSIPEEFAGEEVELFIRKKI